MTAELTPDIATEVVAACQAGADEAAQAIERTFDTPVKINVGEPATVAMDALPETLSGPGLALVLQPGDSGAVVFLPESSGLLPDWYASPDATGTSKLATLAQELGFLLLPESLAVDTFAAGKVDDVAAALERGGLADGAALVPLELTAGEDQYATLSLVWPAEKPGAVLETSGDAGAECAESGSDSEPAKSVDKEPAKSGAKPGQAPKHDTEPTGGAKAAPAQQPAATPTPKIPVSDVGQLPTYAHSLLRIKVPVTVTLAAKKQPIGQVLDFVPGTIIQFDRSCDEMLELEIGDRQVGLGEAVKVGDKFGLRITSFDLPDERFRTVRLTE